MAGMDSLFTEYPSAAEAVTQILAALNKQRGQKDLAGLPVTLKNGVAYQVFRLTGVRPSSRLWAV